MSKINRHPVRRTAAGVLAGALALSGAVAAGTPAFAATGFALERVQGNDRYETSAAIAAAFGQSANIILASGESGRTPDALAANFLAGVRNAPVLLTRRDTTPEPILAQLRTMRAGGATRITVVGGPVAVADAQLESLRALGFTVDRVAGANRYETAAAVALEGEEGEAQAASNIGIIASGVSTIDALAGGPLSFKGRHPLFLVTRDDAPGATIAALRATGVTSVFILGGEAVVGPQVVAELAAAGITVRERLAGANRSETSVAIANRLIADFGFSATSFNLASGVNEGIDALGGAALSGKENRVLLITNTATSAAPVTAFATAQASTLTAAGRIFGGEAAVSGTLETGVETAGGSPAGLRVGPDEAVTLQAVANPDTVTTDNRTYTASGLTAGVEYRATLVLAGNITTNAQGQSVFADADNDNLADTGTVTADITQVNGAAPNNNTGAGSASTTTGGTTSTVVFTAQADGTATFVVDGDQAESVRPVVYVNGGGSSDGTAGQGGTSPRLELDANNVPTEAFDLGGVTTFTAPVVQSATVRPELQSAQILGTVTTNQVTPGNPAGTTVRYTFDENVLETGAPPDGANFKIFNADGSQADSTVTVLDVDATSVVVRFDAINTTALAEVLTVATVVPEAVRDPDGNTNPEGDAAIGTTTAGGGATTLAAGVTDRPDLVSVGGFRQGATVDTFAVDFVFDEAAFVANSTGFALITPGENAAEVRGTGPAAGSPAVSGTTGGTPSGGTVAGGNGTTTITVIFPGTLTAADVSRATVDLGTVSDAQQDTATAAVEGNVNPLQAVDVSNGGNTAEPDLVSAELRPTADGSAGGSVLFTFDQPVTTAAFTPGTTTTAGTTPDTAPLFQVYTDDGTVRTGTGQPAINTAGDARQVLVNFADISRVVGASVGDAAVTAGTSSTNVTADANEQDEVGVTGTPIGGTEGRTRGLTGAPDLTSVTIARGPSNTDQFGNVTQGAFQATYSFDEDVDATVTGGDFRLYLADGTALTGTTTCAVGTGATGTADDDSFDHTVVCTDFSVVTNGTVGAATNAQLGSATLGTVLEDAVRDQTGATTATGGTNPDGAELTTGGTGTPTA